MRNKLVCGCQQSDDTSLNGVSKQSKGEEARRRVLNGSPGIAIPYADPLHPKKLRDTRFRLDYPAEIGGKPAKYISRKGAGNLIFFPPGCSDKLPDISVPVFL